MDQQKRAAGHHTGKPSTNMDSLRRSFASIGDVRQAVLVTARIEEHAERAGFRRGRGGKWHCGVHRDKNPSCTIRDGRIRCWVCGKAWNAIDLEMLATGEPFLGALRAVAREYGLQMASEAYNPAEAKRKALDCQATQERAFSWRAGFLEVAVEMLEEEKAKLFDPVNGPANESLIFRLTRAERIVRETESRRFLVCIYAAFKRIMPVLTDGLVKYGEQRRYETQAAMLELLELLAKAEDRW